MSKPNWIACATLRGVGRKIPLNTWLARGEQNEEAEESCPSVFSCGRGINNSGAWQVTLMGVLGSMMVKLKAR